MHGSLRRAGWCLAALLTLVPLRGAGGITIRVASPSAPPEWALLERELFRANTSACEDSSPATSTTAATWMRRALGR